MADSRYPDALGDDSPGPKPTFGELMKSFRSRANLLQRDLAREIARRLDRKIDETYVSKWERSRDPVVPHRDILECAADVFGVTVDERLELFVAAERVPVQVESWLVREQPGALRLYRSLSQLPSDQQEAMLARLIDQVEADLHASPPPLSTESPEGSLSLTGPESRAPTDDDAPPLRAFEARRSQRPRRAED